MNLLEKIHYGWVDKKHQIHQEVDETFSDNYILQSPKEVIQNHVGVCWDQVELERYYLKGNDYPIKTYFLVHYDNHNCPTHTFLTYKKNKKYYWFEHAWEKFRGIHEYDSEQELLKDVKNKFIQFELNNQYQEKNIHLHEYAKPKSHITVQEFYKHCDNGTYIDINI